MKQIEIVKHRLFGLTRRIVRNIPEGWGEVSAEQFIAIAMLFQGKISDDEFFVAFFNLPKRIHLDYYLLYKLSESISFIGDPTVRMDSFVVTQLPGKLLAPGRRLKGMTFEQFMLIDTYFNRYVKSPSEPLLDLFVAHLYLKKQECFVLPAGRSFSLFSTRKRAVELPSRLEFLKSVDFYTKYAVFLNYIFIKKWLSNSFKFLFPESAEVVETKRNKMKVASVNWIDVFDAFVGDDIAQMDRYKEMPATTAFRLMNKRIRDDQKRK